MPQFPPGVHLIGGRNAAVKLRQMAVEFYANITPVVAELRRQGLSLRAIAGELDRRGIKTRFQNGPWTATQVSRLLARDAVREQPVVVAEPISVEIPSLAQIVDQAIANDNDAKAKSDVPATLKMGGPLSY